jgi:predicted nucleic acid-binding protein
VKRLFVDTGAWYALVDADDPDHERVLPAFRAHRGKLLTSNFVFDEAVTLMRYKLGWGVAHQFGQQLRGGHVASVERITPKDETVAWSIFEHCEDKSFSFTDCTSFVLVQRLELPLCLAVDSDFRTFGLHCLPD